VVFHTFRSTTWLTTYGFQGQLCGFKVILPYMVQGQPRTQVGPFYSGVKQTERDAGHFRLSNADVEEWVYL